MFQWARQERYRRESAFQTLSAAKQWTAVTVVGFGTSTAKPWGGEPSNSGQDFVHLEYAEYVKCEGQYSYA